MWAENGNAEEGDPVAQAWGTRVRRRRTARWVEKGNAARRARRKWAWRRRARKKARRRRVTQRGRARTWARRGRTRRGRGGGRRHGGGDMGWNDAEEGEMKVVGNAAAQMAKGWAEQGEEEEGSEEEGDAKAGGGGGRRGGGERREGRADVLRPVMAWVGVGSAGERSGELTKTKGRGTSPRLPYSNLHIEDVRMDVLARCVCCESGREGD
ncbi:uncharacterized protein BXZ73DRAFT_82591 [Epithele typhae]|uniref:uncharacterized protein n=1 Tax=Epithele typhae TaxID=378194 RepID=UPI002007CB66|nr:uncharacterized protein BXZ73DRAFT_84023 [Epithele typhae]XP_047871577.1 uncharacterized protein BXZ73DRAFT_82591 [Epithele typhae]KAH9910116.1 hypothetical protein BXZ73DRAFT_84023 [Epithele typhae]KAH9911817.1 hypothetical protein BXZ73DRAFT_82591 [Epithele typhae]